MLKDNWLIFKDIDTLSEQLANDILNVANHSIRSTNKFTIVLAGGTSFSSVYRILNNSKSNWKKWYIYIGDERCLALGNQNRNDYLINKIWLGGGLIPKKNINFIHSELGADVGALHYEEIVREIKKFDVVLLGMGEDGHTASLFPSHIYDNSKKVVVEKNSPKHPKNRISMSYKMLNKSNNVFKLISGSSKQNAVELWLKGVDLPINKIYGGCEKVYACLDCMPN
jgi:6-phosphogluconolactonase